MVAEADAAEQALGLVRELAPEVVVMDLRFPGQSGIERIRVLAREHPAVRVLVLTIRERQILELIARGYDNRRIARDLTLSDKTVRNHVSNLFLFAKLNAASRAEAIVRARDAGLGRLRD